MRLLAATLGTVLLLGSATAAAQSVEQQAAARARFEEGIALMKRHEFQKACPLLEESLDLAADMTTAFRLAECYEQTRRPGLAWRYYAEVAEAAGRAGMSERRDYARLHAEALAPRLARLFVEVAEPAPPDLEIELDDRVLARALWGREVRVEPGTHVLRANAPGFHPWESSVDVPTRKTQAHVVVELQALPPPPAPPPSSEPVGWVPPPIIGITLTSVGAATLLTGVIVAGAAKARYDGSLESCVEDSCTEDGLSQQDEAVTMGDAATVLFVLGSVTTAAGAGFWIATALLEPDDAADDVPEEEAAGLSIGVRGAEVVVRATF
jgi:hypothetical protein